MKQKTTFRTLLICMGFGAIVAWTAASTDTKSYVFGFIAGVVVSLAIYHCRQLNRIDREERLLNALEWLG